MTPEGTCPSCGREVDAPADLGQARELVEAEEPEAVSAPWHFWVMVVGVVIYLGWRFIEGAVWAIRSWF